MSRCLIYCGWLALGLCLSLSAFADVPGKATPQDKELTELLAARQKAAQDGVDANVALYRTGRIPVESVCASIDRLLSSGLEAAQSSDECVKHCSSVLEIAKGVEQQVATKHQAQVESAQSHALATYTRLNAEIMLHRARKEAGH